MKFVAFERSKQGTGASRRLRITGRTPGIVYGGDQTPQLIEVDHNALWHALKSEAFHSSVLDMEVNGQASRVLLRDYQMHPFKQQVLHIDFQRVTAGTRLHLKVPLHFSGEENSPAVKNEGCIANHILNEIEVLCLPRDLPEFISVDLSGLTKGSTVNLEDIELPKGVKAVTHGSNKNPVIVSTAVISGGEPEAAPALAEAPAADAKAADKGAKK